MLGELFITAGLVLGLFVVYSLWWTNILADQQAQHEGSKLRQEWAEPGGKEGALNTRGGIGFLHIPALNNGAVLVKRGTSTSVLNEGVAGYYTTPLPATLPTSGKDGNFALAAHRDGHGAKFHNIDRLTKGDPVVFETRDTWYVYKVYAVLPETTKADTAALAPIPRESGATAPARYITLTSCTPVYTSRYRYIVWGRLQRTQRVDDRRSLPPELKR